MIMQIALRVPKIWHRCYGIFKSDYNCFYNHLETNVKTAARKNVGSKLP